MCTVYALAPEEQYTAAEETLEVWCSTAECLGWHGLKVGVMICRCVWTCPGRVLWCLWVACLSPANVQMEIAVDKLSWNNVHTFLASLIF